MRVVETNEESILAREALAALATQASPGNPNREEPPTPALLQQMDACWRAANYLSVGQIYLLDNPLLREPLRLEHVKPDCSVTGAPRPGLNFIYVHLNRAIIEQTT